MDPLTEPPWTRSPSVTDAVWVRVEEDSAVAGARRRASALAERIGIAGAERGRVQLVATEAATNLARHAIRGEMLLRISRLGTVSAVEIICLDRGPGMADAPTAGLDGYSTAGTLGIGLGAIERNADAGGLYSVPRDGTVMFARFLEPGGARTAADPVPGARPDPASGPPFAGITRPIDGEQECGDAYAAVQHDGVVYAMVCDGLGHGPLAARAAAEAVRAVSEVKLPSRPGQIVQHVHRALAGTRGGAVAVAAVDPRARRVRFAGLGNVAAWILGADRRQGMVSMPGIAGGRGRTAVREHSYDLPPDAAVVLHSDGLTGSWGVSERPGLARRDPLLVAATVLRDAGHRHDDRAVLAVTASGRNGGP
jgi:anti-sigma regulatory factor (Ser/Thr protein kinase)